MTLFEYWVGMVILAAVGTFVFGIATLQGYASADILWLGGGLLTIGGFGSGLHRKGKPDQNIWFFVGAYGLTLHMLSPLTQTGFGLGGAALVLMSWEIGRRLTGAQKPEDKSARVFAFLLLAGSVGALLLFHYWDELGTRGRLLLAAADAVAFVGALQIVSNAAHRRR